MNNFLKFIKNTIINNKSLFLKSLIFIFFIIGIQALLPISMRWIIDSVSAKQSISFLVLCIISYALILIISNFLDVAWMKFLDKLGGKIIDDIRTDLYKSINLANYEDLIMIGKEKLKNILYMDTLNIFSSIACYSIQIIANSFLIIVFLCISAYINLKLTSVLLIASIVGFLISMLSRKPIANASMKVNLKMKEDNKTLNEYVDSLELSKTNNLDNYFLCKMKKSLWNFINTSIKADNMLVFLRNLVTDFHQVTSMALAAILSMTMGNSSAGNLVFYLFVSDMVLDTSQKIESYIYSLVKMMPSFENINDILTLNQCAATKNITNIETIEFKNVDFYYKGTSSKIIDNKSVVVKKGDVVRITGSNGGGKSTFVKLVKGLLYPKNGDVLLNGLSTKYISIDSLKNEILYIDQDEILLNDEIKSYLEAISGAKISHDQLKHLQEVVQLDKDISKISENGHSLSGGQRKKLLMIKLLLKYKSASVIILDEIEAGLDIETKNLLLKIEQEIIKTKKDCIFFKITHEDMKDIEYTQTISV